MIQLTIRISGRFILIILIFQVQKPQQQDTDGEDAPMKEKEDQESRIDFREYLLCALFVIKFKQPPIQLIELAFKV